MNSTIPNLSYQDNDTNIFISNSFIVHNGDDPRVNVNNSKCCFKGCFTPEPPLWKEVALKDGLIMDLIRGRYLGVQLFM